MRSRENPIEYLTAPPACGEPPFAWRDDLTRGPVWRARFKQGYAPSREYVFEQRTPDQAYGAEAQAPWLIASDDLTLSNRTARRPKSTRTALARLIRIPWEIDRVDEAKQQIIEYANRHGFLGQGVELADRGDRHRYGESVNSWRRHIRILQICELLRKHIADETGTGASALDNLIAREVDEPPVWVLRCSHDRLAAVGPYPLDMLELGTPYWPPAGSNPRIRHIARQILERIVNPQLAELVSPRAVMQPQHPVCLIPHCLLGALYAQVALNAIGDLPEVRFCHRPECDNPIVDRHYDADYCSDDCYAKDRARLQKLKRAEARTAAAAE